MMDEKSPCCGANVTYSGDGELYCKKCYKAVDPSVLQGPPVEVKLPEGQGQKAQRFNVTCHECGQIGGNLTEAEAEALAERHDDKDKHEVWWHHG